MSTTDNDNPCAEIDPTAGIDYGNRARNQLMEEYPWLWEKSVEFDFAERLGGCTDPPLKEIDHAMFELWTARRNAMSIADSHRFGRMTMSKTDRDAAIRPPGSDCQESIAATCPWCAVESRKRHEEWCPCSAASRRFIREQHGVSDEAGMRAADRVREAAQTISGAGRVRT